MTDNLIELALRCEKATGPDRELDALIYAAINNASVKPYPLSSDFGPHDRWQFWSKDGAHFLGSEQRFRMKPVTASLDAIVALIGEKLPGRTIGMLDCWQDGKPAGLIGGEGKSLDLLLATIATGNTRTLALCAAFLRALASKGDRDA